MSGARHQNHMRMQAALAQGLVGKPKGGLVTDYDPDHYAVKVMLQPENIETGWLTIETAMAGNGYGIYAAPTNGDQAMVSFLEGDKEVGWCTGFLPNDVDQPPSVPAGQIWVLHKDGAFLKFLPDGVVALTAPGGFDVTADTTITGKLHVTDDVTLDSDLNVDGDTAFTGSNVIHGGKNIGKTHEHSGVTTGGGNTGVVV